MEARLHERDGELEALSDALADAAGGRGRGVRVAGRGRRRRRRRGSRARAGIIDGSEGLRFESDPCGDEDAVRLLRAAGSEALVAGDAALPVCAGLPADPLEFAGRIAHVYRVAVDDGDPPAS